MPESALDPTAGVFIFSDRTPESHADPELQDWVDCGFDTVLEMSGHEPRLQLGYGGYGSGLGHGYGGYTSTQFHQQSWNMQPQNFQHGVAGSLGQSQTFNLSFQRHNNQFHNLNRQYGGPATNHHLNQGHHGPHLQSQGYPSGGDPFSVPSQPIHMPQLQGTYQRNGLWVPQETEAGFQRPTPVLVTASSPHLQAPNGPQGNSGFTVGFTNQQGSFMEPVNALMTTDGIWYQYPPHRDLDRPYPPLDLNVPAEVPSPLLEIAKMEQPVHCNPNCKFPHPASVACALCGPPVRLHERFHTMPETLWRPSLGAYARKVQHEDQTAPDSHQPPLNDASQPELKAGGAFSSAVVPAVPPLATPASAIDPSAAIDTPATPPPGIPPPTVPSPSILDNLQLPVTTSNKTSDPGPQFHAARVNFERVKALEESSSNAQGPPPRIPNPYLRMRDWAEVIGVNPLPGVGVHMANMNIVVRRPDYPSGASGQSRYFQRPPEPITLCSNRPSTMHVGNPGETLPPLTDSIQEGLGDEGKVETEEAGDVVGAGVLQENREDSEGYRSDAVGRHGHKSVQPLTPVEPTEQELEVIDLGLRLPPGEFKPAVIEAALQLPPPVIMTPMELIQRENEILIPDLPLTPAESIQRELVLIEPAGTLAQALTPAKPTQQEHEAKQEDLPVTPARPALHECTVIEPALPLTPAEPTQHEVEAKQPNLLESPMQLPEQEPAVVGPALPLDIMAATHQDLELPDDQQEKMQETEPTHVEVDTEAAEAPLAADATTDQPLSTAPNQSEATGSGVHSEPATHPHPTAADQRTFSWASIVAGGRQ